MRLTRVYLPLTAGQCRDLEQHRALEGPLPAFAATDAVRGCDPSGDEEAWEYAALQDAAASCVSEGRPVVVAAADVDAGKVRPTAGSGVEVTGPVTLPRVAALHLGDDVLAPGTMLDPEAEVELSWYDTTELAHVVSLVSQALPTDEPEE